jgi:hypothetical protein
MGGVLAPNGKIYGIPYNSVSILCIDPATDTAETFGSFTGTGKWWSGVLAPNGKIYGIPLYANAVLVLTVKNAEPFSRNMCLSPYLNKF